MKIEIRDEFLIKEIKSEPRRIKLYREDSVGYKLLYIICFKQYKDITLIALDNSIEMLLSVGCKDKDGNITFIFNEPEREYKDIINYICEEF